MNHTFEVNSEYLEHLFGMGYKKERKNHKYIKKIETPKGVRYFYTQADLRAYYAGVRVKDKLGFDERDRLKAARSKYENASKERKRTATDYSNTRYRERSSQNYSISTTEYAKKELEQARNAEISAKRELEKSEEDYSKTLLGKFENLVQIVKKVGKKKVSDIVVNSVKKISELYNEASDPFKIVASGIKAEGITEYPVNKSIIQRDEKNIIERLCGGDLTQGSCVSLAMAYAGNKAGYDVLDFRGGTSCDFFSNVNNLKNIALMSDVDSKVIDYDGQEVTALSSAQELLSDVYNSEPGKEYLLVAGGHMAAVRRFKNELQYLEMQSGSDAVSNGWHTLDYDTLIWRFNIPIDETSIFKRRTYSGSSMLFDVNSLSQSEEFLSLLSYINTPQNEQWKGGSGHVK